MPRCYYKNAHTSQPGTVLECACFPSILITPFFIFKHVPVWTINYMITSVLLATGRDLGEVPITQSLHCSQLCVSSECNWILLFPISDEIRKQDYNSSHRGPWAAELGTPLHKLFFPFGNLWLLSSLSTNTLINHHVIMRRLERRMPSMWHSLFQENTNTHTHVPVLTGSLLRESQE